MSKKSEWGSLQNEVALLAILQSLSISRVQFQRNKQHFDLHFVQSRAGTSIVMAIEQGNVDDHAWRKVVDNFREFMWKMLAILSRVFLVAHQVIEGAITRGCPDYALPTTPDGCEILILGQP